MSYICKGDIPKSCSKCPQRTLYHGISVCLAANKMKVSTSNKYRHEKCPLVELPKNHGRLIDADISVGSYVETWTCNCSEFGTQRVMAVDDLKYLPTIIEAEVNNEQRTKYAICRPYDGITLNTEVEFLLDHNGNVMLFDSESAAWEYFKPIGIAEGEPNAIKVVEYKEVSE